MLTVRKSEDRGPTKMGWLDSKHSFSFGSYRDPGHMGFRNLRVINEDVVTPGAGFGRHGHSDMEIVSYVVDGALGHRDSTGTDGVIRPGEIQRMSAGTGIEHSEMNASSTEPVHFLQIWIIPDRQGVEPGYEQLAMPEVTEDAQLDLIAGPQGGEHAVKIHADARIYRASLRAGAQLDIELDPERGAWVQAVKGSATINGEAISAGDGLAAEHEILLNIISTDEPAELLIFDLA